MLQELTDALRTPGQDVDPHMVARAFTALHTLRDGEGIVKLKDAYLEGLAAEGKPAAEAASVVAQNLDYAARLADEVARCGYESSGQFMLDLPDGGPVNDWYHEVTEN